MTLPLDEAALAYRHAHDASQTASRLAKAASGRYTTHRTRNAREAMATAWAKADRAMRAEFAARDQLAQAALDATATPALDLGAA